MATRRALLVGINSHLNSSFNLRGCVNDVDSLHAVLRDLYAFGHDQIRVLKDSQATRSAILAELQNLFSGVSEGDVLVFGFAAHGTRHTEAEIRARSRRSYLTIPRPPLI